MFDQLTPASPFIYIALIGSISSASSVSRDGTTLPNVGDPASLASATVDAWYWNQTVNIVFVKIFDNRPDSTVSVNY